MFRPYPTPEALREVLRYKNGKLFWKINAPRSHSIKAGKEAGYISKYGRNHEYIIAWITNGGRSGYYSRGRVIFSMLNDIPLTEMTKLTLARKDNNPLNDHIENLYLITRSEQNHRQRKSTIDKRNGVFPLDKKGKCIVGIIKDGKRYRIGIFADPILAQEAYLKKEKELYPK